MTPITSSPLFKGLDSAALTDIMDRLQRRHYQPEEHLCRLGAPGDSLFIIESGLVEVVIDLPKSTTLLDRLRHGDIVGEMALITGEPRAASVVAVLPTTVLELTRDAFAAIVARYPSVLFNINHILIQRQKRSNAYLLEQRRRGEAIALLMGHHTEAIVADTIAALQAADPQGAAVIDLTGVLPVRQITLEEPGVAAALSQLDDLLVDYRTVILVADPQQQELALLVKTMDRVDLIAGLPEARQVYGQIREAAKRVELIVLADESPNWSEEAGNLPVRHAISRASLKQDLGWLARHLARRKIGLAFGAGGAKGFAHVGALSVLEEAGYTIDYIAGSSMGGLVGGLLAMGMDSAEIEATVKRIWSPDNVAELGVFSQEGLSVGLQEVMQATRAVAGELTFAGLKTPLTVMTADLNAQQPAPVREGRVGEALCAGMTIPGMVPPYIRGAQRLVDGIAIMPVPTAAVRDAGADLVIAINLLSRETLAAWPTETPPPPAQRKASRMLDPVIETLIMLQMDESIRHAAEAEVVITPRFGPMSWRDFHLADLAREAGRQAAEEQLPCLLNQVKPS